MHAPRDMTALAAEKAALAARIALQRDDIVGAAQEVTRPLVVIDHCLDLWCGLPPLVRFAGSALGGLVAGRCLRSLLRRSWLGPLNPMVFGILRR